MIEITISFVRERAEHNTQEEHLGMREKVERKKKYVEENKKFLMHIEHTLVARLFELL